MLRKAGLRFGLAQRTMLLLVAAVSGSLAVLAAGFALQRQDDMADMADTRARFVASQVHSMQLVLEAVPPEHRQKVSEGLRSSGTAYAFRSGDVQPPAPLPSDARPPPAPGLLQQVTGAPASDPLAIAQAIRRYASQPAEVRYGLEPGPAFWVSQRIDGEEWWLVVLAGRPPPAPASLPWWLVVAVLAALLTVAALFAATITRPLRKLAVATHRIGDSWPEPVHVDGPAELRELASSFNAMLVRLRQIEDERRVLLGGLPHDLRAPLTRLRLRLATLTDLGEDAGVSEDIASIDHIVRQFTEYLRGVQPDEPRHPLGEIVQVAAEAYRGVGRDVQVELDGSAGVAVPRYAVRRLLDNLIENAVQHGMEPVSIRVARGEDGLVEVAVTDHGRGIPAERAEAAFEPFTKLDPARGSSGCGLGLAIVRQLTRQLGGAVRFHRHANSFSVVASIGVE